MTITLPTGPNKPVEPLSPGERAMHIRDAEERLTELHDLPFLVADELDEEQRLLRLLAELQDCHN